MRVSAAFQLQFFWRDGSVRKEFRAGVSLHSHTMYSEESLTGAMTVIRRLPYFGHAIRRHETEYGRARGVNLDLSHGFWTPPLSPRQAYRLEQKHIEQRFQLPALVSLTDHDDIRAGTQLAVLERFSHAPISTEWTVPFGETFFHLGVHNLARSKANLLMREMAAYTAGLRERELGRMLEALAANPDVLIVFNHPLWDEKGIGRENHARAVAEFLRQHGRFVHALELNGLRTMSENRLVARMGTERNLPVVGGGDRHGVEPNAILNLTRAQSLAEFIHEVRYERSSHVVFMPQYRRPQILHIIHTIIDVMRDYPENFEGRRCWRDRVFYRDPETHEPVPFASVCGANGMELIGRLIDALRVVDRRPPSVILTSA
jgi:hypothetical protein